MNNELILGYFTLFSPQPDGIYCKSTPHNTQTTFRRGEEKDEKKSQPARVLSVTLPCQERLHRKTDLKKCNKTRRGQRQEEKKEGGQTSFFLHHNNITTDSIIEATRSII